MANRKLLYPSLSKSLFKPPIPPSSLVFSTFSQPAPIASVATHQQPSPIFEVAKIVLAVTPATLVFTKFSEPAVHSGTQGYIDVDVSNTSQVIASSPAQISVFTKFSEPSRFRVQEGFVANTTLPPTPIVIVAGGFQDWDPPSRTKIIQEGYVTSTSLPTVASVSSNSVAFSGFPFAFRNKLFYQAGSFVPPIPPPPPPQPYIFSAFEQPRFYKPTAFQDVTNFLQEIDTTTQVWVFSSFAQFQPSGKIFHQAGHLVLPQQPVVVQPFVFSSFEQPQFRKLFLDTPVRFELLSIANPIPPVFTGFNDFGTAQQLIGTQRRQDGSSVDFRVLQPVFVPSVVQFGGWYDFGLRPAPTSFKAYEQPQVVYEILVPPIPLESAFAGKRWKYQETKKTPEIKNKVLPLKSSNLAAMSYDEDKKELRLTFKTYKYENVSKKKVQNLSHGEYFQKHIKAKHPTTKV